MKERPTQELVTEALKMAIEQRRPESGVLHHSDQGIQYSSGVYLRLIKQHGVVRSMSRKGNCYDNAVAESFFSSLKNELIHHRDYHSREDARSEIFEYIELFYNRQRIHQSLGYQTPIRYEEMKGVA
jgi:transposase InsO family protein